MAPYLKQVGAGARILDAGCGLGEWTVFLSGQGYDVFAVDVARRTLAQLRAHFPTHRFLCADIRRLCFPDRFFEVCFSWGAFEHFEEGLGGCITEAWRVVRPGGYLFLSVPFHNWRLILRDARSRRRRDGTADPESDHTTPMRFYQWRLTIPEIEQELAMRGFRPLRVRPISVHEGVSRTLTHDVHLSPGSLIHKAATRLLAPVLPRRWFAHMIMAVAERRA